MNPSQNKEASIDELVEAMSHIIMKDVEIKTLKEENQKLKHEVAQGMEKSNKIQSENKAMQQEVAKLK
jgi:FtsZ-binding cell division protein ZapB